VVNADLIVVLRDGRIVESGTTTLLLEQDGWYASQWRYQQLEASLDASDRTPKAIPARRPAGRRPAAPRRAGRTAPPLAGPRPG
jgi:ABC-type glutathione transport system ATPase component